MQEQLGKLYIFLCAIHPIAKNPDEILERLRGNLGVSGYRDVGGVRIVDESGGVPWVWLAS